MPTVRCTVNYSGLSWLESFMRRIICYFINLDILVRIYWWADFAPNIRPVSDLRNYNEVLKETAIGEPVFLTKNGRGRYAIIDMAEYEKYKITIK